MKGLTQFYVTSHRGVGTHSPDFLSDAPPVPSPHLPTRVKVKAGKPTPRLWLCCLTAGVDSIPSLLFPTVSTAPALCGECELLFRK